MQNFSAVAVPLDPLVTYIYIQHEMSCNCPQPRPSFAWILALRNIISLRNIIFPIIDQYSWSSSVLFYEKATTLYGSFHGWGWTASRLEWEPLWGGCLLFNIKFPEIAGTQFLSTSEWQTAQILWNLIQRNGYRLQLKCHFLR